MRRSFGNGQSVEQKAAAQTQKTKTVIAGSFWTSQFTNKETGEVEDRHSIRLGDPNNKDPQYVRHVTVTVTDAEGKVVKEVTNGSLILYPVDSANPKAPKFRAALVEPKAKE